MNIFEKIAKVLEIKEITLTKAEQLIGVSQGTLTKAMQRGGNIHESTKEKFTRYFRINPVWWETGKGEVFLEKTADIKKEDDILDHPLVKSYVSQIESLNKLIELLERENEELRRKK